MKILWITILIIMVCFYVFTIRMSENDCKNEQFQEDIENNEIHIIVARYNENVDWLKTDPFNKYKQFIYEKGPHPLNGPNCKTLPNVGREGHTYLYHIIQHYEILPDVIIFLPGSATEPNKKKKTYNLMKQLTKTKIKERCEFVLNKNYLNDLSAFKIDEYQSSNYHNKTVNPEKKLLEASPRPFGKWFSINFPTIKRLPTLWYNGIFSVTREQILRFPKQFYINLYNQMNTHSNPEVGHYMERAWSGIFCDGL